ncbi:F0F1 ATP synthase subunit delta [Pelistega ratti]|uniref:F0F1 ATP synthase subunit delta n=1 Tax=Pelistega ratti TaxID=2652177 RepID=UPI001357BC40|nr:F0F1 ATP synthase subunit delta [Pelistega ratti]
MAELSTIARPYAEALYATARDKNTVAQWSSVLSELAQISSNEDVREVMADPRLSKTQRKDLLLGLVKNTLPADASNFLDLLVENDRVITLPEIAEQFEDLKNRHEGSAIAKIVTAFELSETQVQELLTGLEKKFGVKLKPEITVDNSIIGGVRVTVGDQVLDTSVQAQLTRLRDTLATQ